MMATTSGEGSPEAATEKKVSAEDPSPKPTPTAQRKIPGNLPYLTATGTFKNVLEKLIEAARPPKFNIDYLENVLKMTGGAARATIPILKRMEFLTSDGTPTEHYGRFRTESGRASAALHGLRAGFPEIFKRSEYAHAVDDAKLKDIILEITGLSPTDPIARSIRSTFNVVRAFVPEGTTFVNPDESDTPISDEPIANPAPATGEHQHVATRAGRNSLGLVYNINLVIPETSDVRVLNAIFRSIKENLLS